MTIVEFNFKELGKQQQYDIHKSISEKGPIAFFGNLDEGRYHHIYDINGNAFSLRGKYEFTKDGDESELWFFPKYGTLFGKERKLSRLVKKLRLEEYIVREDSD